MPKVAYLYFKGWFAIDLVSTVPVSLAVGETILLTPLLHPC